MLLGVIADDFTGASDIANTLVKGLDGRSGLRTAQFLGLPDRAASADIEAGVVSLKSRSIPVDDAIALSRAALRWLQAQGCRQFVFKYCSTFDSTPEGNIGPVAEALAADLGAGGVVVCPAFPTMGRTVYQGHLFVNDALLSESGMEHHPLTPMTDPDIRRFLALQTSGPVGHVPWTAVSRGAAAVSDALRGSAGRGETLTVVDAISDDDLAVIGQATEDAVLLTGGSGIARGLPHNFIRRGLAAGRKAALPIVGGDKAILAGSCSRATRRQIAHHAENHPVMAIDIDDVMHGRVSPETIVAFVASHRGEEPLAYSSGSPDDVTAAQTTYGREAVSGRLDDFFGEAARLLVDAGIRRLIVAGGETSGAVVSALNLRALTIGPEIDPGVPVLVSEEGAHPVALALKSGNFGSDDFFAKALRLEGTP